jgi:hypothetical protein
LPDIASDGDDDRIAVEDGNFAGTTTIEDASSEAGGVYGPSLRLVSDHSNPKREKFPVKKIGEVKITGQRGDRTQDLRVISTTL